MHAMDFKRATLSRDGQLLALAPKPCREDCLHAALTTFQRHGGVASGDDVTRMLRRRTSQPISQLARWIVAREVVCLDLFPFSQLPLFQFDADVACVKSGVTRILTELRSLSDSFDIATWFTTPNSWLAGELPVAAMARDELQVFEAARADRFVVCG